MKIKYFLLICFLILYVSARPTKLKPIEQVVKDRLQDEKNEFVKYFLSTMLKHPNFLKIFELKEIPNRQHPSAYVEWG